MAASVYLQTQCHIVVCGHTHRQALTKADFMYAYVHILALNTHTHKHIDKNYTQRREQEGKWGVKSPCVKNEYINDSKYKQVSVELGTLHCQILM